MAKRIDVYITNKKVITSRSLEGRPLAAGGEVHYCSVREISKIEKVISEEDEVALKLVEELAAEKNLKFQIIDVSSLKGKLKARLKGVGTTPTIIVGNKRLIGTPKKEILETLLKQ
jgi:glutaredoxin